MTQRNGRLHSGPGVVAVCILLGGSPLAMGRVQVGAGIAVPGLSIGINIPAYPELAPIPGYPVYYAPAGSTNLFFYDGLYWVYVGDNWYYSSWYDGPWSLAEPDLVPDFILRVPIRYYRSPPPFFLRWNRAAPPRWGDHWGRAWEKHRRGWDRWDHVSVPPRAPLPGYQRHYPRGRYPGADGRRNLENRYYHYRPRDPRDRFRLEQAPQFGRRIAPQPNRPPQDRRHPGAPPEDHRIRPSPAQRPPALTRPPMSERVERRAPGANRPGPRSGARPVHPPNSSGSAGQQEHRKEPQARGDTERGERPPQRPPLNDRL